VRDGATEVRVQELPAQSEAATQRFARNVRWRTDETVQGAYAAVSEERPNRSSEFQRFIRRIARAPRCSEVGRARRRPATRSAQSSRCSPHMKPMVPVPARSSR
jgi:hypothetical protein